MRLLSGLCRELLHAERSAAKHCTSEAQRLGSCPPGMVLRAVAGHANDALLELALVCQICELPAGSWVERLVSLFSVARSTLLDPLLPKQMSYRGTLLGLRHGADVVRLLRQTSMVTGYHEIAEWCDRFTATRAPLIELASEELSWFAENPRRAVARASLSSLLRAREVTSALGA